MSYAGSVAILGKGSIVSFCATSGGTYTPLAELIKAQIPKISTKDVDATNMNSTAEEFIEGLPSAGEVDVECTYVKAEFVVLFAQVGAGKMYWKITLPDTTVCSFAGFTKDVMTDLETQTKIVTKFKIKPTGLPTVA